RGRVHCYVVTWVEDRHELLDLHRLQSPAPMRSIFGAEQDSSLCGIDQDDRVWCWKELQGHDPPEWQDLPPAREAARVGDRLCVRTIVDGAGQIVCRRDGEPLTHVGRPGVVQIAAGDQHMCWRDEQNRVSCWGRNHYGQLGAVSPTIMLEPVRIEFPTITPRSSTRDPSASTPPKSRDKAPARRR